MTRHSDYPSTETLADELSSRVDQPESSTAPLPPLLGRLHYWWSLFVAAMLLLIIGPPTLFITASLGRRHWLYPWALFGAHAWLALSGMRVRVRGREHLDPAQAYVFISNHRSYLDTATLFYYLGRRIGIIAKKELLKVPILGYGMSFVNIMAIDRSNRERAIETMRQATDRLRAGISFGVFAEGTRAPVGQLLPFKKGAFYMAVEAGVPVVPVAIRQTDHLMGKGTGVSRPGTIELIIMPPVKTKGLTSDEEVEALIERVHGAVAKELGLAGAPALRRRTKAKQS